MYLLSKRKNLRNYDMKIYRIMHTTFNDRILKVYVASDSNLKHENWSAGIKKIHNRHVILLWSKKEVDICSPNLNSMHKICIAHIPVHIKKLHAVYSKIC